MKTSAASTLAAVATSDATPKCPDCGCILHTFGNELRCGKCRKFFPRPAPTSSGQSKE